VIKEFRLPDAGEGLTEAEIVTWRVRPGDAVKVNDVIVEIETAKSLVELPCPWAGVVAGLLVAVGETVPVGTPIIAVEVPDDAVVGSGSAEPVAPATVRPAVQPPSSRTPVLVGYGVKDETGTRRARRVVEELIKNGKIVRGDSGIVSVYKTDRGLLISRSVL